MENFLHNLWTFFEGLLTISKGIASGIGQMFNFVNYITVINDYRSDLTGMGLVVMIYL